ncbi:MAG: thioredoxin [Methanoregulaceae archaeon]|jgi:thioredoxin 1
MDDELAKIREKKMQELRDRFTPTKKPAQHHANVIVIDEAHFVKIVRENPHLVIDFWAEWCGPCRRVAPIVEELAQEFTGKVTFGKCNTDENQRIAMQFGISAIPTMLFFANGQMVDRLIGALPKEMIHSKIVRNFSL